MATIWLTYAWEDNAQGDVDYVAQELVAAGVHVKLDRWNLRAGKRLWEQIASFIQDPTECDAWVLCATQQSLGSEACKEEFAYALQRALATRGEAFPVIGILPAAVDNSLIPPGISTRLYVSTTDPDWKERIRAAAEGRTPAITRPSLAPYSLQLHRLDSQPDRAHVIEVRPRAGTWSPFFAAVPLAEKEKLKPSISHGPCGRVPNGVVLFSTGQGPSDDNNWWMMFAQNEATPTQSYFMHCSELPSQLAFGVHNGQPQYVVTREDLLR